MLTEEPIPTKRNNRPAPSAYLFLIILAISLAGNVYLMHKNNSLNVSLVEAYRPHQLVNKAGTVVDHLTVTDTAGKQSKLPLRGDGDTVVYVYSPNCGWCAANYSSILSLAKQRGSDYKFVGLSILPDKAGLEQYLVKHPYPFPSYIDSSATDLDSLGFSGTPQTILIDRNGTIKHVWEGAYGQKTGRDIEQFFSMKLPDISKSYMSTN